MNIAPIEAGSAVQNFTVVTAAARSGGVAQSHTNKGEEAQASSERLERMVDSINQQLQKMSVSLQFSRYGKDGEKVSVVVADKETGEVIREIPSEEIQRLYSSISDLIGVIFNDQA